MAAAEPQEPYPSVEVARIYAGRLATFGPGPLAQGWYGARTQERRFSVLAEVSDLREGSVLDVGCGLGDFYSFLHARGGAGDYIGVDLTPEMVENARRRHPGARF